MANRLKWFADYVLLPMLFVSLVITPVLHSYLGDGWSTKVLIVSLVNLGILIFVTFVNIRSELRVLRYEVWAMRENPPKVYLSVNNGEPAELKHAMEPGPLGSTH